MKYWKVRASAIGLTMVMLVPGMAYGQGKDSTYCREWKWIWNQCVQQGGTSDSGNPPSAESGSAGDIEIVGDQTASAVAAAMLESVNDQRRSTGLEELTLSAELSRVAQIKAEDMRDHGYFSHTSPTYGSPFDMMKEFGIRYRSAGENIAKGYRTVDAVMKGWMNSSGHRANILSSSYTQLGVGYCTDSAGNGYWVQMFLRQ